MHHARRGLDCEQTEASVNQRSRIQVICIRTYPGSRAASNKRRTSYYCPHFKKLYKEKQANTANMINQPPTTRELDILKSIAKGMNTHEISEHLFISENTVEWHRKNLMLKFGARNATDLVIKALAKGFLSIPLE